MRIFGSLLSIIALIGADLSFLAIIGEIEAHGSIWVSFGGFLVCGILVATGLMVALEPKGD
jgi:hypothetical protein